MIETEKIISQFLKDQNYTREEYEQEKAIHRNIIVCPICGKLTMDEYFICSNCHWEDGYYLDEEDKVKCRKSYENRKDSRRKI